MKAAGLSAASVTLLFALSVLATAVGNGVWHNVQDDGIKEGDAVVWYLGHCGYAVRTQNHMLIFDYIELEEDPSERSLEAGFIDPEEIKDLDVSVFVTHEHIDHFDEIIFSWEKVVKNIDFFFGWKAQDNPEYHYLTGPRAEIKVGDMEIYTVNSFHAGVPEVAYLVKVDGLTIFHGGDYQGRKGRGAPSNVVEDMLYMKTKIESVDLLFLGAWTGDPYLKIIENLTPKFIFPMHDRKKEHRYLIFADDLKKLGFEIPVVCPTKRGDSFIYMNGEIQ